jgi:hypothetical protein
VLLTAVLLPLPAHAQRAATVQWSTYLGGSEVDRVSVVTQLDGNTIAVGSTASSSLTPNSTGTRPTGTDVFVVRFESGDGVLSSDFAALVFGGSGIDVPFAVASGPASELYVVGQSNSPGFTTGTNYRQPMGSTGMNAFLSRISPTGTLEWTMFFSGTGDEAATGVTVVGSKVYVTGWTASTNFMNNSTSVPMSNNGFVMEIEINGGLPSVGWDLQPLILGGDGIDMFHGITQGMDENGLNKLYVAGTTTSTGFTYGARVKGTYKGGASDAIVVRLDTESGNLDWLTFVGGSGADEGAAIATGSLSASVVMAGTTNSPGNLNTTGSPLPETNAFVAWVLPSGDLKLSEVRQGSGDDVALAVTTDSAGNAYVGGKTASITFQGVPTSGFDTTIESGTGFREGFVWMAPPEGGQGWASFVGGIGVDEVTSLSLRESNRLVLGLQTGSSSQMPVAPGNPPTPPPYDGSLGGTQDGFLLSVAVADLSAPGAGVVRDRPQVDTDPTDISTTTSTNALFANWSGFGDTSAITKYEWALGTRANPTAIQPLTALATLDTSAGATGLNLTVGEEYVVTVRATNLYGLTTVARSNGVRVTYSDGGVPPVPDGGTGTPDSGTGTPDSGTGTPDSGTNTPDAGTDGGTTGPGDGGGGGGGGDGPDKDRESPIGWDVGCASGGGAAPVFLSLLALVLLGRRLRTR